MKPFRLLFYENAYIIFEVVVVYINDYEGYILGAFVLVQGVVLYYYQCISTPLIRLTVCFICI